MLSDRELIDFAAKAAGIGGEWELDPSYIQERWRFMVPYDKHGMLTAFEWNPLNDDGDALRLGAELMFEGKMECDLSVLTFNYVSKGEDADPCRAIRLAITRAAADVGSKMADVLQPSQLEPRTNEQKAVDPGSIIETISLNTFNLKDRD
jgi:hypothetical protein